MERQNAKELRIQMPGAVSSFTEQVVASPMTQLAMNFEGICTRTPTGRRRSISKPIRRSGLIRSISSPFASCAKDEEGPLKDNSCEIVEEDMDENNNKENDFEFAKPSMPIYRSASSAGKRRPISAPAELMSPGISPRRESTDCEGMVVHFSVDEDDDGFIDYAQLEQNEDDAFTVSSTVAGLMTKPLSSSNIDNNQHSGSGSTLKGSVETKLEPCGLFHPIACTSSPEVKPRRSKSVSMKRPVPPRDPSPEERKKLRARCSSAIEASWNSPLLLAGERKPARSPLMRSMSVVESRTRGADIDKYLKAGQDNNHLIGDFSKQDILPTVKGQHQDLKTVAPETVSRVLDLEFQEHIDQVYIIDCRYPYEYDGGHIKTAMNMHTKEEIYNFFLKKPKSCPEKRTVLIFHCEFSSKRAPTLYRYLRNKDRDSHTHCYPKLFYPEIYVIHGGYKAFFESCQEYCEPQTYRPMVDENFTQEYKRFSRRSKSWTDGQNGPTVRKTYRQGLQF
ncbi:M-phase inducer phosphatase 1-like [Paramuricea clavata]|uniref:M-phase inducer phosphatase n=1 Tax=Paramuricea clavata TaxID=317549 RepID=A0A7D9D669_PARCT|nr:M-phase inducer phosphatase 1-like [Paramuricea clavata]